jgi:hypothetical protein
MNARGGKDRAIMWLGAVSVLSVAFHFIKGELQFVQIPNAGMVVAVVLGVVAMAGGALRNNLITLAAGAGFLAAAIAQVALQTAGASLANGSNGSTAGLWLGLGAGLLVLALTPEGQQPGDSPEIP